MDRENQILQRVYAGHWVNPLPRVYVEARCLTLFFAGTEVLNALNYAEVAVTLDNSDGFIAGAGETIRVERHIYRNGDNDYLIDGRKVRLRDIHDLFMDTGLGRDSFSIISQGRVEASF
mgnify:CR=1 FL=1